jgi:hypothetical protein
MHSILGAAEALGEPLVGLVAVPPSTTPGFGSHPAESTPSPCRSAAGRPTSWCVS